MQLVHREQDSSVLGKIQRLDVNGIYQEGLATSMCGLGVTLFAVEMAREIFGRREGRRLNYAVGSDISQRGLEDQTGFASFILI